MNDRRAMDPPGSTAFARECCVQTVARVCIQLGFDTAEESALEAVADVIRYFVSTLARRTHANMIHSQRTSVALNDLLAAFRQAPSARVSWRSLQDFAFRADGRGWNLPSHLVVPVLPVGKRQRVYNNQLTAVDQDRSVLIPTFLPPFPPVHTYVTVDETAPSSAIPDAQATSAKHPDMIREREALQLALNRISRAANGGLMETNDELSDEKDRYAGASFENPVVIEDSSPTLVQHEADS